MDWAIILTTFGTALAIIGFVYGFLRNFKTDINSHIDKLEKRMDNFETRMNSLDERMFLMATGKKLEDAILEERIKSQNVLKVKKPI